MRSIFVRQIVRRDVFRPRSLPWVARIYKYPFERWSTPGRQALFGAPNLLLFYLYSRFVPFASLGTMTVRCGSDEKVVRFNARNTQFQAVYSTRFRMGYEPQITALIDSLITDSAVFLDIGSNWGWFAITVASRPGFIGRVLAFEPFPSTFDDLRTTVDQSGLANRIECHQAAVSDQIGECGITLPDGVHSGLATLSAKPSKNKVRTLTLDSLNLPKVDVIKVDAEGSELKVFSGAERLLQQQRPMLIFENSRGSEEFESCLRPLLFLERLGYLFFQVGWMRQFEKKSCLVGDDADPEPQADEALALARFEIGERGLLPQGLNVFACHRERLAQLTATFQPFG